MVLHNKRIKKDDPQKSVPTEDQEEKKPFLLGDPDPLYQQHVSPSAAAGEEDGGENKNLLLPHIPRRVPGGSSTPTSNEPSAVDESQTAEGLFDLRRSRTSTTSDVVEKDRSEPVPVGEERPVDDPAEEQLGTSPASFSLSTAGKLESTIQELVEVHRRTIQHAAEQQPVQVLGLSYLEAAGITDEIPAAAKKHLASLGFPSEKGGGMEPEGEPSAAGSAENDVGPVDELVDVEEGDPDLGGRGPEEGMEVPWSDVQTDENECYHLRTEVSEKDVQMFNACMGSPGGGRPGRAEGDENGDEEGALLIGCPVDASRENNSPQQTKAPACPGPVGAGAPKQQNTTGGVSAETRRVDGSWGIVPPLLQHMRLGLSSLQHIAEDNSRSQQQGMISLTLDCQDSRVVKSSLSECRGTCGDGREEGRDAT